MPTFCRILPICLQFTQTIPIFPVQYFLNKSIESFQCKFHFVSSFVQTSFWVLNEKKKIKINTHMLNDAPDYNNINVLRLICGSAHIVFAGRSVLLLHSLVLLLNAYNWLTRPNVYSFDWNLSVSPDQLNVFCFNFDNKFFSLNLLLLSNSLCEIPLGLLIGEIKARFDSLSVDENKNKKLSTLNCSSVKCDMCQSELQSTEHNIYYVIALLAQNVHLLSIIVQYNLNGNL